MSDLASWLLEQIGIDEALANGVATDSQGNTWVFTDDGIRAVATLTRAMHVGDTAVFPRPPADPKRTLAECEAKRLIVEAHHAELMDVVDGMEHWTDCADCRQGPPCRTLRLLALPYANRDGYREEWRP